MNIRQSLLVTLILLCGLVVPAGSQDLLRFEAASIKKNNSSDSRLRDFGVQPGGRFVSTNATVRLLIQNAYQLRGFQILGGPTWAGSDGYDIEAAPTPGNAVTVRQTWEMVKSLLQDRFKLKTHFETREMPVYVLEIAKNGPTLPSHKEGTCASPGSSVPIHGPGALTPCGSAAVSISKEATRLVGGSISISELVRILSTVLGRAVIDKTGLTEVFDLDLVFVPDQVSGRLLDLGAADNPAAGTIFTAIQEQLGLKLRSDRGPAEVLVIDSVERPSEN